jgi:hypothetical protein
MFLLKRSDDLTHCWEPDTEELEVALQVCLLSGSSCLIALTA